jgi:hypothetical protein
MRRPGLAVRGFWGAQCDGTPALLGPVHDRRHGRHLRCTDAGPAQRGGEEC